MRPLSCWAAQCPPHSSGLGCSLRPSPFLPAGRAAGDPQGCPLTPLSRFFPRFPAGLANAACPCRDSSSYHDYAELQSFQSDLSYDNLWEAEEKELGTPCSSPSPAQQIYQV